MASTVQDGIDAIQTLMGDPRGATYNAAYCIPMLAFAYPFVYINIKNASGKNFQGMITVPNVPAGTSSLYPWQNANAKAGQAPAQNDNPAYPPLLDGLYDPIQVWVKVAGTPPQYYRKLRDRMTPDPTVNPQVSGSASAQLYNMNSLWYAWSGNQLIIAPCSQPLDIWVLGKFNPPKLKSPDQLLQVHPDILIPLVLQVTRQIGTEKSNPAILADYTLMGKEVLSNIIAEIIRTGQAEPAKFQKVVDGFRNAGGCNYGWR